MEIQPEISLFGSLKSIDLHRNKIVSLPDQFADLTAITTLDLSHNALTSLPANIFSLPALSNLNVANNSLTSLPFMAPFSTTKTRPTQTTRRDFFGTPEISRATTPLPKLAILDASNNKIVANMIDLDIPKAIVTLDLSSNPLEANGPEACSKLFKALAALKKLKVLRCERAEISDHVFDHTSLSSSSFPSISVLDLGSTTVTENGVAFGLKGLTQQLTFEVTNEDPPPGVARVIVGKKIVREAWEVEAARRSKSRAGKTVDVESELGNAPAPGKVAAMPQKRVPVVKEAWEIDAEQGLLTEGGKRRARAAAAAASATTDSSLGLGPPPSQSSSVPKTSSLADPQYYTSRTETLTLPPTTAPPKASGHSRAFSLASTSLIKSPPPRANDVTLPTATLPLTLIATQPFAHTLKVLLLTNRRVDRSFTLPSLPNGGSLLPRLEELSLEGCNLADHIPISTASASETLPVVSTLNKPIFPLITELFPSLRILNMAYNMLTGAALTTDVLSALILSSASAESAPTAVERKGLKQLHLRGNRIAELDGFQALGLLFKGNREVPGWGLEELDLRDNEIGKLPSELGLLPLDVFLVDGNVFRVPARRVWEREGTKGLLSWLRGRIE
ncbi:hypothetical protein B0H10DRAFT_486184 [Mycena sp. CBHHK59/15]|nr:hypothetical protein B0H10DRAFT_486184 [Mycena sp. CBHHK59/15]